MPLALVDVETYAFREASANTFEAEMGQDYWTYLVDYNRAKEGITRVLEEYQNMLPDHHQVLCFGSRNNFRYTIYDQYKSNRNKQRRPAGLKDFYEWIKENWAYQEHEGIEGDDVVGINADPEHGDVIISLDKDLKTLPGLHAQGQGVIDISPLEADHAFYMQVLTGDTADGYPGCPGIGKVKAAGLLEKCKTSQEMWEKVLGAFEKAHLSREYALKMARCARILRPGEYDMENQRVSLWMPPE